MTAAEWPPLREELRGIEPYGAPQLSREQAPVQLNVNENPYGPSPECAADIARADEASATGVVPFRVCGLLRAFVVAVHHYR